MAAMTSSPHNQPDPSAAALADVPDRNCTWCKVPMLKRLVGGGQYIHYTCPKCVFQHATKRANKK
jgi:hypothetical protein